ncbi:MAG: DUF3581 family protein [Methylococcales bacterium]|jgi:hypothetical protein|nr:DUF3581 family protein [Methylococcales bacterium]
MKLETYYSRLNDQIEFTREQASDFAKTIAGDFNPIHDPDAKRFCVPGDLLFAVMLKHFGISQRMTFTFSGMVDGGVSLSFDQHGEQNIDLIDDKNKKYISVKREGELCDKDEVIEALTKCYVKFSGKTFPHILVPLMKANNVMINPKRPLVIYENMFIDLVQCSTSAVALELDTENTKLETNGKRGTVTLAFALKDIDGKTVGNGEKHMVLSGLQPFQQSEMDALIDEFEARKANY